MLTIMSSFKVQPPLHGKATVRPKALQRRDPTRRPRARRRLGEIKERVARRRQMHLCRSVLLHVGPEHPDDFGPL